MLYIIKNDKMYMEQIKVDLVINKNIYVVDNIPFIYLFKKKVLILVVMFFCVGTTTGIAQSYNPYNMNLLYQGAAILQARIDANKDKVNDKVNDVFDTIDDVEIAIGGFNEAQKKELNKFYETVERTKVNYSDNDEIRELLSWLDSWKRHFRSWAKSQRRRW